ncbi:MAG: methyltetrahydrofolate cobalamin methyltransferase [Deltaproteobacteria bacterium]|nr:methyltetrahydrofolate cobalamin methyltransferase [Deltaproteobacteria bacterium]
MIIIGELINASRKAIGEAIEAQDAETIKKVAADQAEAGASFIDVNAGVFLEKEPEYLSWLVQNVQAVTDKPCSIDSPNPKAIEAALSVHRGTPMINSISLEKDRYERMLPILAGTDMKVIALCMSDEGMPQTTDDRMKIADQLINMLTKSHIPLENIFVDPLVQPISVNGNFGVEFLDAVEKIMTEYKGIHTACGLSNVSYGLPGRKHLNRTFMIQAISKGLDGAIVNPMDKGMIAAIVMAEALAGRDQFCGKYLKAFRAKIIEG